MCRLSGPFSTGDSISIQLKSPAVGVRHDGHVAPRRLERSFYNAPTHIFNIRNGFVGISNRETETSGAVRRLALRQRVDFKDDIAETSGEMAWAAAVLLLSTFGVLRTSRRIEGSAIPVSVVKRERSQSVSMAVRARLPTRSFHVDFRSLGNTAKERSKLEVLRRPPKEAN